MTRLTPMPLLIALVVFLTFAEPGGQAVAAELAPAGAPAQMIEENTGGTPLESIADEAAMAGDGEARPEDEDPMARTEAGMIESADEDGCTGSVGADCPGGND